MISPFTPTRRAYHTRGRPIAIAPSENGVDKHKGRDDTCVAAKATPPFFNATAGVKRLGKGRDWQWNEDAGLGYPPPPSSFAQNEAARIRPLSSSFTYSELIRTAAPRRSSENPTAVFAVPTLRAHSHRTQTKMVIIPPLSSSCPHLAASLVTLAAQSSVVPTTVLLHPLPTTAPFEANTPAGGGVIPSVPHYCAHTLYLYYPAATVLQLMQDATTASSVQMSIDIFRLIHSFAPSYKIKCDYCHIGPCSVALKSTCLVTCPLGSSLELSDIHFVRQQPTEPSDCQMAT